MYISNAWNPSIHRLIFVRLASRAFHRYPSEHSLNLVVVKALLRDILQNILGILSALRVLGCVLKALLRDILQNILGTLSVLGSSVYISNAWNPSVIAW